MTRSLRTRDRLEEMRVRICEVGATSAVVVVRQIQRQLDFEVVSEGETNPETEFRHYERDEEFKIRDVR
jgi:hypothetical protein